MPGNAESDVAEDTTVLIPAAGRVPESVIALANVSSPAMVPVAGRPLIYWTLRYLIGSGIRRFRIGVAERGLFLEEFVQVVFGGDSDIQFVVPSEDRGVGGTVAALAEGVETERALVVLGDTHFEFADADRLFSDAPVVLTESVEASARWCCADVGEDGYVTALHEKVPDLPTPTNALIGVYSFPSAEDLRAACDAQLSARDGRLEMSHLLLGLPGAPAIRAEQADRWIDCGNPDRQAEAQKAMIQERAFNQLQVDSVLGTITKRSTNVTKFVDEINYLRLLPPSLAVLYPRLVDFSVEWDDAWVTMEFYGYPTLSEVFIFESVDAGIWRRVFVHLVEVMREGLFAHRRDIDAGDVRAMYFDKLAERASGITGPEPLARLHRADEVVVNGVTMPGLPVSWERIGEAVEHLAKNVQGSIVHGDLCLPNILYDLRSSVCKLIDARGSFGRVGIYGDPRYDVAKLHHSLHGHYDFAITDLFSIDVDDNRIDYRIHHRPDHQAIRDVFDAVVLEHFDADEIGLISGLILLGLPALHYDAPKRQLLFFARGLELVHQHLGPVLDAAGATQR